MSKEVPECSLNKTCNRIWPGFNHLEKCYPELESVVAIAADDDDDGDDGGCCCCFMYRLDATTATRLCNKQNATLAYTNRKAKQ